MNKPNIGHNLKVYIAGPYTKGIIEDNVNNAILTAELISQYGFTPFIPHLTHYWELLIHHEYDFWIKQDLEWLSACDILLRIEGESAGADAEVQIAKEIGMPVFFSPRNMIAYYNNGKV